MVDLNSAPSPVRNHQGQPGSNGVLATPAFVSDKRPSGRLRISVVFGQFAIDQIRQQYPGKLLGFPVEHAEQGRVLEQVPIDENPVSRRHPVAGMCDAV